MKVQSTFVASARPKDASAFVASADAMELFSGYGPVPGIARAEFTSNDEIETTDHRGRVHRERVTGYKDGCSLTVDIYPFGWSGFFVRSISEIWLFRPAGTKTAIQRIFVVRPRPWGSLFLLPASIFLRRAVKENNKAIAEALQRGQKPVRPFPLAESRRAKN